MRINFVLTLTGTDRIGLVEDVTRKVLELDGNVETSRMAHLGGEFAMLMLVSMPTERQPQLDAMTQTLIAQGFKVTISRTDMSSARSYAGWLPYRIEVLGADDEGIIHTLASQLSQRGINIESMETGTSPAPTTGTPLFSMTALVVVPPDAGSDWKSALESTGDKLNVDIRITRAAS